MLLEIQKHINKTIEMVGKENLWYLIADTDTSQYTNFTLL